jgi:hypothetical protein
MTLPPTGAGLPRAVKISRWLLSLIALAVVVRSGFYLVYVVEKFFYPYKSFYLIEDIPAEAKMVHLAWRAQTGISLYPEWRDYPHVSNFFGPVYFLLVGALGRAANARLEDLFIVGRLISIASGLGTTLLVGLSARSRYGTWAGLLAAAFSLGGRAMYDASATTRPDMTAQCLGFGGFLLALACRPWQSALGVAGLVLAILTKQTAGVFLAGAAIALVASGQRLRALAITLGAVGLVVVLGGAATLRWEPNIIPSMLGESGTPWSFREWQERLKTVITLLPDQIVFLTIGIVIWRAPSHRWVAPLCLAAVIVPVSLITTAKRGADVNYFLDLRIVNALALAALWHVVQQPTAIGWHGTRLVKCTAIGLLSLAPGVLVAFFNALVAGTVHDFQRGSPGRVTASMYDVAARVARNPGARILTDAGYLDIQQGARTLYGDGWLFRLQVETGQIYPAKIIADLENRRYDFIITRNDLFTEDYDFYNRAFPKAIADAARRHYEPLNRTQLFHWYQRRALPVRAPSAGTLPPKGHDATVNKPGQVELRPR